MKKVLVGTLIIMLLANSSLASAMTSNRFIGNAKVSDESKIGGTLSMPIFHKEVIEYSEIVFLDRKELLGLYEKYNNGGSKRDFSEGFGRMVAREDTIGDNESRYCKNEKEIRNLVTRRVRWNFKKTLDDIRTKLMRDTSEKFVIKLKYRRIIILYDGGTYPAEVESFDLVGIEFK